MGLVRILLADDHTIVRHGLRRMLEEHPEWQVVAEACDGRQAIRLAEQHRPDVAIIDVAMPLLNGIETTRQLVRKLPGLKVLVLTMYVDEVYVSQMLEAGAMGYLLKDSADTDLFQAVAAIAQGQSFFSPAIARLLVDECMRPAKDTTDRTGSRG
jgi:DNA-binding NarL/FixJ family response regulator